MTNAIEGAYERPIRLNVSNTMRVDSVRPLMDGVPIHEAPRRIVIAGRDTYTVSVVIEILSLKWQLVRLNLATERMTAQSDPCLANSLNFHLDIYIK